MSSKKTKEQILSDIATISELPGVPAWMLDQDNYTGDKKLSQKEQFEFAEFHTGVLRRNAALYYLNSCADRFGFNGKGQQIFCAPGFTAEIDRTVIETLLICQIERYLQEEKPEDKYITPMLFYMGDEVNRKEHASTWLIDFIDSVFIEGAKELESTLNACGNTIH